MCIHINNLNADMQHPGEECHSLCTCHRQDVHESISSSFFIKLQEIFRCMHDEECTDIKCLLHRCILKCFINKEESTLLYINDDNVTNKIFEEAEKLGGTCKIVEINDDTRKGVQIRWPYDIYLM